MRDAFANYDNWLEAPYQKGCEDYDAFVEWAEEWDYDLEDPAEAKKAHERYDEYLFDLWEQKQIDDYEDAMERRYEEARERAMFGDW